jgi:hypothetical protein
MNERHTADSPKNNKKIWSSPALKVIFLNSARHATANGNDGNGGHTGS